VSRVVFQRTTRLRMLYLRGIIVLSPILPLAALALSRKRPSRHPCKHLRHLHRTGVPGGHDAGQEGGEDAECGAPPPGVAGYEKRGPVAEVQATHAVDDGVRQAAAAQAAEQ